MYSDFPSLIPNEAGSSKSSGIYFKGNIYRDEDKTKLY